MYRKLSIAITCLFLLTPLPSFAAIILQQTDKGTSSQNTNSGFQPLGNNFSGVIGSIVFSGSNGLSIATSSISVRPVSCTDSTYSSCTDLLGSDLWQVNINPNTGQHDVTMDVSANPITFTVGIYYGFSISDSQQGNSPLYGSNATSSLPAADPAAYHRVGVVPCTNCSAIIPATNVRQLYFIIYDTLGASTDTTTRIASVTPANNSTIATSSTATMGAIGYVNASDYSSGMYVQMQYALYANSQTSVANPSALFTTINFPITSAGTFSFSTTTSILRSGQYTMQTQIRTPSLLNSVINFFGFDQFATFGIKTATSTKFYAVAPNGFDVFVSSTTASIEAYIASSTVSLASCSSWVSFNLGDCLNIIFVPQVPPIVAALTNFRNTFLSYAPWGYITRFAIIMSGTSTTTIPSINVTIPLGNPNIPAQYSNGTFTLNTMDMLQGGDDLLNTVHTSFGGDLSVQDVTEPFVKLSIALALMMYIVHDLFSMRGGHSKKIAGKLH